MERPVEIAVPMASPPPPRTLAAGSDEDRRVFARLVREHAGVLPALARRLAGDAAEAEDLVQETYLRAWRGLPRFRAEARFRTWLCRILLNVARDHHRRRPPVPGAGAPAREGPDPAEGLARRDLLRRVLSAVDALPPRQREALLLRVQGGLSYREIAKVLGIRRGVVREHLVRARKKLLARFAKEVAEWGIG